jgi:hypothetical protein
MFRNLYLALGLGASMIVGGIVAALHAPADNGNAASGSLRGITILSIIIAIGVVTGGAAWKFFTMKSK